MQSMFRRSVQVFSAAGAVALASMTFASRSDAQSGSGNWGAEARFGSSQSASLIRWFNPSWSLVLNGSASVANNKAENSGIVGTEGNSKNLNATVLLRKEFGTGRVRPHMAFGPSLSLTRTENKATTGPVMSRTNQDITNIGGRFELGGIASVSEHVGLGIIGSASVNRTHQESRSSTSTTKSTTKGTTVSLNSPQLVLRVRF